MSVYAGPNIIESGLALYLDASNSRSYPGSGTVWTDLSGNGNNGTLTNGPTFSSANMGSIVFDGSNDLVNLGSSNNITGNNLQTLTVNIWLQYSTTTMDLRVFTINRGSGISSSLFGIVINAVSVGGVQTSSLGSLGFVTRNFDNTTHSSLTFNDNYHLKNRFINLSCVVDGTNRALYVDGQLKNSDSGAGMQSVSNNTDPTYIACSPTGNSLFFIGSISNALLYRRALTATEIAQNFNALRGRYGL